MMDKYNDMTQKQLEFLSVMEAFNEPVSVNIIGTIAPISPGDFLSLLKKCRSNNWINETSDDLFSLSNKIPEDLSRKLKKMNSREKLVKIIAILESSGLAEKIPKRAFAALLSRSGRAAKAFKMEIDFATNALKRGDIASSEKHIYQIEKMLPLLEESEINEVWFIYDSLEFTRHCQSRAMAIRFQIKLLEKVIKKAEGIGDERSQTIANMLIGRSYWAQNKLQDAVDYLEKGKLKAEALGDNDIITQASLYIGIYYFLKGLQNKAITYLENAVQFAERNGAYLTAFEAPILLAYCYVDRGEFHRAIGKIDFFRHCALRREDYYTASLYRAVLGIILWLINKRKEAVFHLEHSQTDALATNNMVAYWTSLYGLSSLYLMESDLQKGLLLLKQAIDVAETMGMGHQIFHSIFLESYYAAEKAGGKLPAGWKFDEQFKRIMSEPNIHTRGAALRIKAVKLAAEGKHEKQAIRCLKESEALLKESDDPVELAKTRLEMARHYLKNKDQDKARELAYEAYQGLSGYDEIFYPDDLRFLIESVKTKAVPKEKEENITDTFIQMLEDLIPGRSDLSEPDTLITAVSRFFRAERSGLFLFNDRTNRNLKLKAARNLSDIIVHADNFKDNLAVIHKSIAEKKTILIQSGILDQKSKNKKHLSVLCLPLAIGEKILGALYFDNSYLENCFDFINTPVLKKLEHHLTNIIEKYLKTEEIGNTEESIAVEKPIQSVLSGDFDFISEDKKMIHILRQAKRQAESDAAVMIYGETGVGKEVLARWIHQNSKRSGQPFVIVDLTTIPENLVESELFGHEKGSFTGAYRQKIGRIELAHKGTLFIDEIGEVNKDLQVKLLRLIQEKTFVRIGGIKSLVSDFRLIAASSRNLAKEVEAGRFREDLYYRLNVLELNMPPLRERRDDILPIARYYISYYEKKYNRLLNPIQNEQEKYLTEYNWPGNVRELKNVIERAIIIAENNYLEFDFSIKKAESEQNPFSGFPTLDEIQRRYIKYVLSRTRGRIGGTGGAAEILGMKRTSVNSRIKKLGLVTD